MIFRSPYRGIAIPEIALTPFVLEGARRLERKPALIDGASARETTYGELARAIERAAAGLARRGLRKGDVLAILCPNVPEFAIAFHAAALCGATVTTVNPAYTPEEIARQIADAGARLLFTVPELLAKAEGAKVEDVLVLGQASWNAVREDRGPAPRVAIDPREDVVALPYSSGTTGMPKGVMLTHRNLVANMLQLDAAGHVEEDDVLLAVLPFFHIYGLSVILNLGLHKGATIVTLPRFELAAYVAALERWRVTFAHVAPPIVLHLARHPGLEARDLSSLRTISSGAAPLSEGVSRACGERLGCTIRQGYGMTESSPATHASPKDPARIKLGSIGELLPDTECRIVDGSSGKDLGVGEAGELWVRGPQVMKGYLNRPEATAATVDAEGWLHTGDIGNCDEDGHFWVVDRVKELIKYKGLQVAPAELEAVLLAHPCVADAAVIGVPDEEAGEVPKAFVVLKSAAKAEEIMAFVAERVAPHKKVRQLEVIEQIPKSPSGKILRRVLVERERASHNSSP